MRDLLLKLAGMGKTLIVTSHILPELSRICNVVAIITQGKLRAFGSLDQIMRDLRQQRTFEIQLCGPAHVDAAAAVVREALEPGERDGVRALATESLVRFDTARNDTELSAILAALVGRRIDVAQFREIPKDLEDAFLSVTRREAPAA
jgi:ABC-2 type transport system ATP-binding protein